MTILRRRLIYKLSKQLTKLQDNHHQGQHIKSAPAASHSATNTYTDVMSNSSDCTSNNNLDCQDTVTKHDENEDNTKTELLEESHQHINTIQQANVINSPQIENTNTPAVHQSAAVLPSTGHKETVLQSATQLPDNQPTAHKATANHSATQQQVVNSPEDNPPIVIHQKLLQNIHLETTAPICSLHQQQMNTQLRQLFCVTQMDVF